MKSLFEKEEKELIINDLKIDLISRFYSFSNEEILKYKQVLNFDRYHLMDNPNILWDKKLVEDVRELIDWTALFKLRNLKVDLDFLNTFENSIEFSILHLSNNIVWNEDLVDKYGDKLNWNSSCILKVPQPFQLSLLRKYKDVLDWGMVSRRINITFNDELIEEFNDHWNWELLSSNINLPPTVDFIKKHIDKLDFRRLSMNAAFLPLIIKYPESKRWDWNYVAINPGISYDKKMFEFVFEHYKKQQEFHPYITRLFSKLTLPRFILRLFSTQNNKIDYFLEDEFIPYIPWKELSKHCTFQLGTDFISKHHEKLDFTKTEFLEMNKNCITPKFIENNWNLFDKGRYPFYKLSLSRSMVASNLSSVNWHYLSTCQTLDWTWAFIFEHLYELNVDQLSRNEEIFHQLILPSLSNNNLGSFFSRNTKTK